jgi:hypothetical protein
VLVPPVVLGLAAFGSLIGYLDKVLAKTAPIASVEASRLLGRRIHIGGLDPALTVKSLWTMIRRPDTVGTLPITATNIEIGNTKDEIRFAGSPLLGRIPKVTLFVSLPELLNREDKTGVLKRVLVEEPELLVVRDPQGEWNLTKIVPEPPKDKEPEPPFRTVVEIRNARIRWRDFDSARPKKESPAINAFWVPSVVVDMSGARTIQLQATATALAGSSTSRHLQGSVQVRGTLPRGESGALPESPSLNAPGLLVRLEATGADAAYWLYYFLSPIDGFQLQQGQADATLLLAQRPKPPYSASALEKERDDPLVLSAQVDFRNAVVRADTLREPIRDAQGRLEYESGALLFDARARAWGEQIRARGQLWGIPQGDNTPSELQIAADVAIPRLPLQKAIREFDLQKSLPPELKVGGTAVVQAKLAGSLSAIERMMVSGKVAGVEAVYSGYPALRGIRGDFFLKEGILQTRNVRANLQGGGTVQGSALVRVLGRKEQVGNAIFQAQAVNVPLETLSVLEQITKNANAELRLQGRGNVSAIGRFVNKELFAAADITTQNLRLGTTAFPIAQGRVLVERNRVLVPSARIESGLGVASVSGDVSPEGNLDLKWFARGIDIAALARKFGIADAAGLASGYGTVQGTTRSPEVWVSELVALNLRYTLPVDPNKPQQQPRRLALDTVQGKEIQITPDRVRIAPENPLVLRRFPAQITATGDVADLQTANPKVAYSSDPETGANVTTIDPRFNLSVRVTNLDYREVESQLGLAIQLPEKLTGQRAKVVETPLPEPEAEGFSAQILRSGIQITGTLSSPRVSGVAELSKMLLGPYPVEGGRVQFAYDTSKTEVSEFVVFVRSQFVPGTGKTTAAIKGNLILEADGDLIGQFRTGTFFQGTELRDSIDIARLSFLLGGKVQLIGEASLQGAISGDTDTPQVDATLRTPSIEIAGIALKNVVGVGQFRIPEGATQGILRLGQFSFQQGQSSGQSGEDSPNLTVTLNDATYNLQDGTVGATGQVQIADIATLFNALRRSDLPTFEVGERIVRALAQFPPEIGGSIALENISFLGQVGKGDSGLQNPQLSLNLNAKNIRIGEFTTDTLTATAALNDDVIQVAALEAKTATSTIRGNGIYDPDGNVNAVLESNDFHLEALRAFPGLQGFPLRGSIFVSLKVEGKSQTPAITASVFGEKVVVLTGQSSENIGAAAQSERLEGILLNNISLVGSVEQVIPGEGVPANEVGKYQFVLPEGVNTITLGSGEKRAELRLDARLPFSFDPSDSNLSQRPVLVNLSVPKFDLSVLKEVLPRAISDEAIVTVNPEPTPTKVPNTGKQETVDPAGDIGGEFAAKIQLAGSLENPLLSGYASINDGRYRPPRPAGSDRDVFSPIADLDMTARLIGDHICFDRVSYDAYRQTLAEATNTPLTDLEIVAEEGVTLHDSTVLVPAGLNGKKGNFGKFTLGGSITVENLSNLQNYLPQPNSVRQRERARSANTLPGKYELKLAFDGLRIGAENALANAPDPGKGDGFETKIDGTIQVTGNDLTKPFLATPTKEPLRIADLKFRLPSITTEKTGSASLPALNPKFDMAFQIVNKATLYNAGFFNFDVKGDLTLKGNLFKEVATQSDSENKKEESKQEGTTATKPTAEFAFALEGDLVTVGGNITITPLPAFRVLRDGVLEVRYGDILNPGIRIDSTAPVVARTFINANPDNIRSFRSTSMRDAVSSISAFDATSSALERYEITITLSGLVDLSEAEPAVPGNDLLMGNELGRQQSSLSMTFDSNPPLSQEEILAIILPQQQFELARAGRVEDALRSFTTQALTSSLLPGQVGRITDSIASSLGLDDFRVDYNPDGSIPIQFVKRLNPPFERFVIDLARTFQNRSVANQQQPFRFGLSYEVFQLRRRVKGVVPRLQLGFRTDEQRVTTFFLRGTVFY